MTANFPIYLLVMAGVTYLIRMLPLTIFRKEIKSTFIKSFLHYVPFAVLGAMTIPDVLYSTGDMRTAAVGLVAREESADGGACGVCGGAGGAGDSAAVLMIIATKKGIVSEIMDAIPLLVIPDCPAASAELP